MVIRETNLSGIFLIEMEKLEDERGFFARTFCQEEFASRGLCTRMEQCSVSFNKRKGTVRGMHYQVAPCAETKLVRCTSGAIFDVAIDLRKSSPTFKQHYGVELIAEAGNALYIPEGFAHGFQTLVDGTQVFYQISRPYAPGCARGVRWNDPAFGIEWPIEVGTILRRDREYPDFDGEGVN